MHTLKLAVIDISELKGRHFGIDEFRQVIHSRLYKLDPFRYELVDIPFKFHHPMWREDREVHPQYPGPSCRGCNPRGPPHLPDASGRIASTPPGRPPPPWGEGLIEGPAQRTIR